MPDPLFDPLGMPPLDLGETMAPQAPPPSQPSARARAKDFAPLLALLPIVAAKGGQAGVAALLQGFQQQRQQGEATARQTQQDTERQRQVAEQERIRRATLQQNTQNDAAQRRQQFMSTFQNGLQSDALDSPEAVRAFMEFYRPQARALGLRPDAMDAITMEAMTPTRFEKKEATKVIEAAKKQYGEQAATNTYTLKDGTQAGWDELNRRAGVGLGAPVPKVDVPNTSEEQQIADVIAIAEEQLGRPLTRSERAHARLQAVSSFRDAGRAPKTPPDPEMVDLRKQLLEQQVAAAEEKIATQRQTANRAKAAARKTSGETLDVIKQLIAIGPDGQATLQPGVGNLFGARVPGMGYLPGATAKAAAALKRLKGRVIVDLLAEMKSQSRTGATGFGQLTERELDLIQGAATTLDSTFISNDTALEELVRIYNVAKQAYDGAAAGPSQEAPPEPTAPPKNPFRR